MLEGDRGEAPAMAMRIIAAMADVSDAARLLDVTSAHFEGTAPSGRREDFHAHSSDHLSHGIQPKWVLIYEDRRSVVGTHAKGPPFDWACTESLVLSES